MRSLTVRSTTAAAARSTPTPITASSATRIPTTIATFFTRPPPVSRSQPRTMRPTSEESSSSGSGGRAASTAAAVARGCWASSVTRVSTASPQSHTTVAGEERQSPPRTHA